MSHSTPLCPSCGAPLAVEAGRCAACGAPAATPSWAPPAASPVSTLVGFSMQVDDVFEIKKRGLVATGRIASGSIRVGDRVVTDGGVTFTCKAVEMFRKVLDSASAGDNVGLLLDGATKANCSRGTVLRGS